MHFINVQLVHPYSSIDTATAGKKSCLMSSERFDSHMADNQSICSSHFCLAYVDIIFSGRDIAAEAYEVV